MAKAVIGVSGWQYPDFSARFYPEGLEKTKQLGYYAQHFPTVEVNNTFYQLPSENSIEKWRSQVPDDFVFAIKASRYITHMKNLLEPEETLPNLVPASPALAGEPRPTPHLHRASTRGLPFYLRIPQQNLAQRGSIRPAA